MRANHVQGFWASDPIVLAEKINDHIGTEVPEGEDTALVVLAVDSIEYFHDNDEGFPNGHYAIAVYLTEPLP